MVVGLDAVADSGLDPVDMGVDQDHRRFHALVLVVDQLAERPGHAGDQRKLVGGPQALQVVGPQIQGFHGVGRRAFGLHQLAGGFQLGDFVLQPGGEVSREAFERSFSLGDRAGVDSAETTPDLQAKRIGDLDHLTRILLTHCHLLLG